MREENQLLFGNKGAGSVPTKDMNHLMEGVYSGPNKDK